MSRLIRAGAALALLAAGFVPGTFAAEAPVSNPLLAKWSGPYGGVPPFDKVEVAHFKPALEAAMA
jgi:peptidyl-dipeptidase Dcp